jgi:hypothetical protein
MKVDQEILDVNLQEKIFDSRTGEYVSIEKFSHQADRQASDQPTLINRLVNKLNNTGQNEFVVGATPTHRGELVPTIYSKFNNWRPQPMIPLQKLVEFLKYPTQPDFIERLK